MLSTSHILGFRPARHLALTLVAILCAAAVAACGSGSGGSTAKSSGSPFTIAAAQLASADHASFEKPTLVADLTTLYSDCEETTATLATEISDGEQDLIRHGIKAEAQTVANALVTAADVLPKSKVPVVCNQLIATYLSNRGG